MWDLSKCALAFYFVIVIQYSLNLTWGLWCSHNSTWKDHIPNNSKTWHFCLIRNYVGKKMHLNRIRRKSVGIYPQFFHFVFKIPAVIFMWAWGLIINAFHLQMKSLLIVTFAKGKKIQKQNKIQKQKNKWMKTFTKLILLKHVLYDTLYEQIKSSLRKILISTVLDHSLPS